MYVCMYVSSKRKKESHVLFCSALRWPALAGTLVSVRRRLLLYIYIYISIRGFIYRIVQCSLV